MLAIAISVVIVVGLFIITSIISHAINKARDVLDDYENFYD